MAERPTVSQLAGACWLGLWLLICSVVLFAEWAGPAQAEAVSRTQVPDNEIRHRVVQQSVASYPGQCACPYNVMRNGRRCGKVSAYSKPGGSAPKCYPEDVSAAEIAAYRAQRL